MYYCTTTVTAYRPPQGKGQDGVKSAPSGCDDEIKEEICRCTLPTLSQRLSNCRVFMYLTVGSTS